ncbi:MAG: FAD-dependent oxidoreductase [Deinococcus-Thermus bacterium]|jgi:pyruvate/2-oxoglutarate dehydrogenase complex dihydrolipoamide dehydrogenase (E3) component|nr:FAD-dependent oxidoreductase [Deinococcota bacterium]
MTPNPSDTVVVGSGAGGLTVAVGLARLGRRVALVEADQVGGDCTNVGCIPSKTLIEAARRVSGLPASDRAAAADQALAQARRLRDAVRAHDERLLTDTPGIELVRGRARLVSAVRGRVEVDVRGRDGDVRRLQAGRVVLATGSEPALPPVPGLEQAGAPTSHALTNATLFDLTSPPERLLVLGAGAIGCEMAFAFARLGSRVTLVEAEGRVLPAAEPDASDVVRARLEAAGVQVLAGARMTGFDPPTGRATLASGGSEREPPTSIDARRVLVAVGRRPATTDLGLEDAGVALGPRGHVRVDRGYRTSAPGVYAIGDLIGGAFTHVANAQGRRLVRRLALTLPLTPEGDHPSVAFTEPEVGQIGATLEELRQRWPAQLLSVHRVELADTDRGGTMGVQDGFVQLVALRGTGRLLAATVVAPHASEMLPLLTDAQRRGTSLWRLSRLEVAYPALTEAVQRAADDFVFSSLPRLHREAGAYLRWRWAGQAPG